MIVAAITREKLVLLDDDTSRRSLSDLDGRDQIRPSLTEIQLPHLYYSRRSKNVSRKRRFHAEGNYLNASMVSDRRGHVRQSIRIGSCRDPEARSADRQALNTAIRILSTRFDGAIPLLPYRYRRRADLVWDD
jgi:hypothetical protein